MLFVRIFNWNGRMVVVISNKKLAVNLDLFISIDMFFGWQIEYAIISSLRWY